MTEQKWMTTTNPERMLNFLRSWATPQKKRAFIASACTDWVPSANDHPGEELRQFFDEVARWVEDADYEPGGPMFNEFLSLISGGYQDGMFPLWIRVRKRARVAARDTPNVEEKTRGVALLRCIFGNPWRPFRPTTIDPSFLTPTVVALATTIYDDRAWDRLPILADALADAGCDDAELLGHLRGPGPHVRGCWAVDLILGKEQM